MFVVSAALSLKIMHLNNYIFEEVAHVTSASISLWTVWSARWSDRELDWSTHVT